MNKSNDQNLIIIPAYNESASIDKVVGKCRRLGYSVLVVNDASLDDTANIARQAGARVLDHPQNMGAWIAIQTGMRFAIRHEFSRVITMDADGQHDPEHIACLLEAEVRTGADIVIGACPERASRKRLFAWWMLRKLSGFKVQDLTSGFRLYNLSAVGLLSGRDATLLEYQDLGVLLMLRENEMQITETPVPMQQREAGLSRIFSSWGRVFYYMVYSLMLLAGKRLLSPVRKQEF